MNANSPWASHSGKLNANPSLECKQSTREPQGGNESCRHVIYRNQGATAVSLNNNLEQTRATHFGNHRQFYEK